MYVEVINYGYVIVPPLGNHVDVMAAINQLYQKVDQQGNCKAFLFAHAYPGLTIKELCCLYWALRGYSVAQIAA